MSFQLIHRQNSERIQGLSRKTEDKVKWKAKGPGLAGRNYFSKKVTFVTFNRRKKNFGTESTFTKPAFINQNNIIMGIFSFLKNAGAKLFSKEEKAAPKTTESTPAATEESMNRQRAALLKMSVEGLGLPVKGLNVELQGDTVIVSGEVDSQANREKVILALGNVEGIAAVDDRLTVATPAPEAQFYEVKKGDSLSKIAKQFYGNAMKYPVIFEANKPMLKDPDLIYPGQMLRIPPLD